MAKSEKVKFIDKPIFRTVLTIASLVLSAIILIFSSLTMMEINTSYENAPKYLIWIFIGAGVMSIIMFLRKRTKINLIKAGIMLVLNLILGVVVLFAKNNPFLFSLTAGLYCLNLILSCVFTMIQKKQIKSYIFNGLIIVLSIGMAIGLLSSPLTSQGQVQNIILVECIFIALVSFVQAASIAFSQLKGKVLLRIILNSFSLEIIFGLLTMIVCFSLVFMRIEPNIKTFPDALWYSFAIVTTIGFGDYVAVTAIGRVLSVLLGLYGIVVVAVITSIIVNFYNETSGKHDKKEFKEIKKEDDNDI